MNAHYSNMADSADNKSGRGRPSNLLEMIIGLYIRVCCHLYAKDIKEKERI